jgi:nitric oxide reductase subunit B
VSKILPTDGSLRRSEKVLLVLMGCALTCVLLSLAFGALGALYYIPGISAVMTGVGLSLVELRPAHTTFASAWIFLGAAAGVYKYLFDAFGEPNEADMRRFRFHMVCWGLAGLAALVTLPLGITSGREYVGFHPSISLLIWVGWLAFTWNFFAKVWRGFWSRPVYVYMWGVGILYFLWTFAEAHAYLLPGVRRYPVADMQIQWKSCGTLVAAFNQMVYGCLLYMGERKSGDPRVAQSRTAFALFGVGLLNSFTNYAHHTYHLPQSELIKWIAFLVSMTEIILLVRLFSELTAAMPRRGPGLRIDVPSHMVGLSKKWNLFLLTLAIVISVPPWNALIHGTHVVMAHAMGSELAIDSYILIGVFAMILGGLFPRREVRDRLLAGPPVRRSLRAINGFLVGLVAVLLVGGLATGLSRYQGRPDPGLLAGFPYAFAILGLGLGWSLVRLIAIWAPLFLHPQAYRVTGGPPFDSAAH